MGSVACYLMALVSAILYAFPHASFFISWWCLFFWFPDDVYWFKKKHVFVTDIDQLDWKVNDTSMSRRYCYCTQGQYRKYCFLICIKKKFICKIWTCESPEVTLCGWRDYKPSINKQTKQFAISSQLLFWLKLACRVVSCKCRCWPGLCEDCRQRRAWWDGWRETSNLGDGEMLQHHCWFYKPTSKFHYH